MQFVIYRDIGGAARWRLFFGDNQIAMSDKGYPLDECLFWARLITGSNGWTIIRDAASITTEEYNAAWLMSLFLAKPLLRFEVCGQDSWLLPELRWRICTTEGNIVGLSTDTLRNVGQCEQQIKLVNGVNQRPTWYVYQPRPAFRSVLPLSSLVPQCTINLTSSFWGPYRQRTQ